MKVGSLTSKSVSGVNVYTDWRELLDKEKKLDSVNVSTPDHMHAAITMSAIQRGLNVYTQKPLTQTIYEARQLTKAAREKKIVSQMGIQIHSAGVHRTVVATIQAGAIGKVKEIHSWSGKKWGDTGKKPERKDAVPYGFHWDFWLGVADERPFIGGDYYHPANWRKRLDFGTGTFGDMGCHILDPVYGSVELTAPKSVRSEGGAANADNWGLDSQVKYVFPATKYAVDGVTLTWYDGDKRPPAEVQKQVGGSVSGQGSIYLGTEGVLYSNYDGGTMALFPVEKFKDYKIRNSQESITCNLWKRTAWQDVGFVRLFRSPDRDGAARHTLDSFPENDPGMGRGQVGDHQQQGRQRCGASQVPQGMGSGRFVT